MIKELFCFRYDFLITERSKRSRHYCFCDKKLKNFVENKRPGKWANIFQRHAKRIDRQFYTYIYSLSERKRVGGRFSVQEPECPVKAIDFCGNKNGQKTDWKTRKLTTQSFVNKCNRSVDIFAILLLLRFAKFRDRITNVFAFSTNEPPDRPTMRARPRDKWNVICTRVSFRFYRQQSVRLQKFGYNLNISLRAVRKSRRRIIYLSVTFDRIPKLTRWKTNKR